MAITDPTIDPVTGLPILDTSGIVQQIPLGRQTVDYAGWNATAQPTRTPLYPDDVIPVFANVQGQHPQTGNAQNVTTDGEGRLNVHTFPEGGGGVAPVPMGMDTIIYLPGVVAVSNQVYGGYYPLSTIYAMTWGIYFDLSASPTFPIVGRVGVGWSLYPSGDELPTHTFFVAANTADAAAALSQTWTYTFPVPMQSAGTFNHIAPTTRLYPYCNNVTNNTVIPWVQVYMEPF